MGHCLLAAVPLLSGDVTTGTLAFGKVGDREWLPEELNALQAIAALLAQLQARVVAEEQIHYLAEHDELTGLRNRRALIAYLDERLAEGQPGPVAVVFLALDRFKVINDRLGQNAGDRFIEAFAALLRRPPRISPRSSPASAVTSSSSCRPRPWTSRLRRRSRRRCTVGSTGRSPSTVRCSVAP